MFTEKLKEGCKLKNIKSVAWKVTGEDSLKPERTQVRFEDEEGKVFELVLHINPAFEGWKNEEEMILNYILSSKNIMPAGMWCGITANISEVINELRKKYPYEGKFFVNEERCKFTDFETPIHIF